MCGLHQATMIPPQCVVNFVSQSPVQSGVLLCALGFFTHTLARLLVDRRRNPSHLPFPPGPNGYPLIGNVFGMPTSQQWRTYAEWAKVYGDVLSFEVLGQRIVILNSLEAVQELLERKSAYYSSRPRLPMVIELMNFGFAFALLPYGEWWRRSRRMFNEHFRSTAVGKYQPIQIRETRAFLNRLLQSPDKFVSHIRGTLASIIIGITYGIKIDGFDHPYVVNLEESLRAFGIAGVPGTFLVDLIPALKYVPSWFPGAGFKKIGEYYAKVNQKVVELPFNHAVQKIKEGAAGPSVAASLITALPEGDEKLLSEETRIAQGVTAGTYVAGADTTSSTIQTFLLAMAKYPEAQRKAQEELDTVIGPHRLPEFTDRPSLPYVNALIKETLRWQLTVPLAFPHMSTHNDVYEGYFIPKRTLVFGNAWAILHDESVFPNPEEFSPERYLKDEQLDASVRQPEVCAFGFGRRKCPGMYLADNMLFAIVSSTLHTFNVTPSLNDKDVPLPLSTQMTSGVTSYPKPFQVDIKPRSAAAANLVKDAVVCDD